MTGLINRFGASFPGLIHVLIITLERSTIMVVGRSFRGGAYGQALDDSCVSHQLCCNSRGCRYVLRSSVH